MYAIPYTHVCAEIHQNHAKKPATPILRPSLYANEYTSVRKTIRLPTKYPPKRYKTRLARHLLYTPETKNGRKLRHPTPLHAPKTGIHLPTQNKPPNRDHMGMTDTGTGMRMSKHTHHTPHPRPKPRHPTSHRLLPSPLLRTQAEAEEGTPIFLLGVFALGRCRFLGRLWSLGGWSVFGGRWSGLGYGVSFS